MSWLEFSPKFRGCKLGCAWLVSPAVDLQKIPYLVSMRLGDYSLFLSSKLLYASRLQKFGLEIKRRDDLLTDRAFGHLDLGPKSENVRASSS